MADPLLMIPGPIEISPAVREAAAAPPKSHVSPACIASFQRSLKAMRQIWRSPEGALPVVIAGSGTLAMELAVWNCASPGDRALVVDTGYFSERMAEMLRRRGVSVSLISAERPGETVPVEGVLAALELQDFEIVTLTHVDTSTGVRVDVEGITKAAKAAGALVLVDGICATAAERLEMADWGVDVYLTASQKAIGCPPGLALAMFSPAALAAHGSLKAKPPLGLDLDAWRPIMEAYEAGKPSYFATPATSLIAALDASLAEIVGEGIEAVWSRHQRVADQFRACWRELGLDLLPTAEAIAANTLSAVRYPEGSGPELVGRIKEQGIVVAGGLHPALKAEYFRVGHMGWVTTQPELVERTLDGIRAAVRG